MHGELYVFPVCVHLCTLKVPHYIFKRVRRRVLDPGQFAALTFTAAYTGVSTCLEDALTAMETLTIPNGVYEQDFI